MNENAPLGVVMLDVQGMQLTAEDRELLAHPQVGGVILGLFGRNFESIEQLQTLTDAIRRCNPHLLIAVDQEGGRVQRFQNEFSRLPPMHRFGELWEQNAQTALQLAETCGWLMASEVLACGLDLSFAPVLDLYLASSRVIADRAFAADPEIVASLAGAFIDGMHSAGMRATGKHFPGHGSVEADSHVELPEDSRSLEQLLNSDLIPFQRCLGKLDAVMPGHVLYPQVDSQPAALSSTWLQDVLRRRLGFGGVVFSDDLSMAAADGAGDIIDRTRLALTAGCDMVLICNARQQAVSAIEWLESQAWPASTRLAAMRGHGASDRLVLLAERRWQQAHAQIAGLLG